MATKNYITCRENELITAQTSCVESLRAIENERSENRGFLKPENRDCWGTLLVNAQALERSLSELITKLDKYV